MSYSDNNFMEVRAQAMEYMDNKFRTILEDWCKQINYNHPIAYGRHYKYTENGYKKVLKIYSKHPGILIGKAGKNIDLLQEIIKKDFYEPYMIELVEITGNFININKDSED